MRVVTRTVLAAAIFASSFSAVAQRPVFEVASVKHSASAPRFEPVHRSGTLVSAHGTQVGSFIFYAYNLKGAYEVEGIPDWPDETRWFDIDARTPPDATDEQVRLMFQSLLADRFKMKAHRETRQLPAYLLTLGKGKLKLAPSSNEDDTLTVTIETKRLPQAPGACSNTLWIAGVHLVCHAVPMQLIAANLAGDLRSPVADRTGLTGKYDLDLLYWPQDRQTQPDDVFTPRISQALADLGLKLEKGTGPVEVLVIDHIEQPTEN